MDERWRSGAFAARAGVTVRTVRYYDRIGLLRPSGRSEAGQRWYTERDYARLQHILTLKLIGLSLEEIQQVLAADVDSETMGVLLERQKRALKEQAAHLMQVAGMIEAAQEALQSSETIDLETIIQLIKAVNMSTQVNWLDQFMTAEQQAKISQSAMQRTLPEQRAFGMALRDLFRDIQAEQKRMWDATAVENLIRRWDALLAGFAAEGVELQAWIEAAYSQLDQMPGMEQDEWVQELRAAAAFIQHAKAKRNVR